MSNLTAKVKAPNYTPELVAKIVADYDGGKGMTVAAIAAKYDRAPKSIQGKLVYEKVYVVQDKPVKTFADQGPAKKVLIEKLRELGLSQTTLDGLNNATKPALQELLERIPAPVATDEPETAVA